jgi:hypothetical protein
MRTPTPTMQMSAPVRSERSWWKPSKATPQQRADDEHAAIGGQDAAELVAGLEGGDDAVGGQGGGAEGDEEDALVLLDAEPHEVGAADLGDGRGDEQGDGATGHTATVSALPPRPRLVLTLIGRPAAGCGRRRPAR